MKYLKGNVGVEMSGKVKDRTRVEEYPLILLENPLLTGSASCARIL